MHLARKCEPKGFARVNLCVQRLGVNSIDYGKHDHAMTLHFSGNHRSPDFCNLSRLFWALPLLTGCSGSDTSTGAPGTCGDIGVGGLGAGGETSSAGMSATGGTTAAQTFVGGSAATGGSLSLGGGKASGGSVAVGGNQATGGTLSGIGGLSTGGAPAAGGAKNAGGANSTGQLLHSRRDRCAHIHRLQRVFGRQGPAPLLYECEYHVEHRRQHDEQHVHEHDGQQANRRQRRRIRARLQLHARCHGTSASNGHERRRAAIVSGRRSSANDGLGDIAQKLALFRAVTAPRKRYNSFDCRLVWHSGTWLRVTCCSPPLRPFRVGWTRFSCA